MRLDDFIEQNRAELNAAINGAIYRYDGKGGRGVIPTPAPVHDDEQIGDWINNDEGLYNWALSEGALEEYEIEDESDLQAAFWKAHPQFVEIPGQRQNDYNATIRTAWCDYVDMQQKSGIISEDLADSATLG